MPVRVEHLVTSGTFELDGGRWDVDNNVWLVGDDDEVIVIDAAHDAEAIVAAVDGRRVRSIVCTHAHNDHVNAAPALADRTGAPILLHAADAALWGLSHNDRQWDVDLRDGEAIEVADVEGAILHTPGHAPGAVCLYFPTLEVVFTGDTLFAGGPGATGRSFSDFPTIIESISSRLLSLPSATVVHAGHGADTTIGDEAPHLDEWVVRGR